MEEILNVSDKLNLKDITYDSFILQYDRKTQYSAADLVYCLSSILQSPRKLSKLGIALKDNHIEIIPNTRTKNTATADDILQENFWAAYDALSENNHRIIKQGIELAIETQIAIVNQGTALIEKKSIYPAQEIRYAVMQSESLQEIKFFQNPLGLQRLALFVMDAYKETKKSVKYKPLVLCVLNGQTNSFLVVGVTGVQGMSEVPKNSFGIKFRKAALDANARINHDGFETSIIEILKDDFEGFIDELCSKKK